jgi:cell division protein FtsZ
MSERCRMMLVGVGGAGCQSLGRLRRDWPDGPDMLALHTDPAVLAACGLERAVALGPVVTRGLSSGGDLMLGARAAEESEDAVRPLFAGADLVFVVAGLGGGTGGGATPAVCRWARREGAMVLAICTLPFFFEGTQRRQFAEDALQQVREAADAVLVIPNQRLLDRPGESLPVLGAFKRVDDFVAAGIRALWRVLSQTGLINLDFADLRRLVAVSDGVLTLAVSEGRGADRARQALEGLSVHPMMGRGDVLRAARALLVGIAGGPDMTLTELQDLLTEITASARPDVDLHIGTSVASEYAGRLVLTVLATEQLAAPAATATATVEHPAVEEAPPAAAPAADAAESARRAARIVQGRLPLESSGRGRFNNVEPTLYDGEDLDVPTFLRRGIRLSTA